LQAVTIAEVLSSEGYYTKAVIGNPYVKKGFGLVALLFGAFMGGYLVKQRGYKYSLIFAGILQLVSNLTFVVQYYVGANISVLFATIGIENFCGGMGTAAFIAYISYLCNIRYTATQFALLTSLSGMIFGFGYLMCFFNKKRKTLHDYIVKTIVVSEGINY